MNFVRLVGYWKSNGNEYHREVWVAPDAVAEVVQIPFESPARCTVVMRSGREHECAGFSADVARQLKEAEA